jgi:hypothetical protein
VVVMMRKLFAWVVFKLSRHTRWYAVKHKRSGAWVCAARKDAEAPDWHVYNLNLSVEFGPAEWFDEPVEAYLWMLARIGYTWVDDYQLVRLDVRFASNHYHMTEVAWVS